MDKVIKCPVLRTSYDREETNPIEHLHDRNLCHTGLTRCTAGGSVAMVTVLTLRRIYSAILLFVTSGNRHSMQSLVSCLSSRIEDTTLR